jgi:hypothetical protein
LLQLFDLEKVGETLHNEGKITVFLKKGQKKFPTHEEKRMTFKKRKVF